MLTRLAEGRHPGAQNYDPESTGEEVFERRRPIFDLLVTWARRLDD